MAVTETLMGLGSWSITLAEETPKDLLDRLSFFGHVAVQPGRLDPAQYRDNLLTSSRYVGVLTVRDFAETKKVGGQGMAVWLGDSDDKGEVFETPLTITGKTFANSIRDILGSGTAVIEGTLYSAAGTYTGTHIWQSRRKAVDYVCQLFNCEWRVNGPATLDAGPATSLFQATPTNIILRKGSEGRDLNMVALPGDMSLARDVQDWSDRVVLIAEGEGQATATASANIASNPYLDLRGQPVKRTRLISESGTSTGNAQARAQLQLNRFSGTRNALRLSTSDYDLRAVASDVRGTVNVGDWVWVWDPDAGVFDTSTEITFRGQRLNPLKLRVVEASWPVAEGMTVAYRAQDGTWWDLTPYVRWETGSTSLTVGELGRSLTNAGTEPVGPRPIPDTTVPGVVSWDLPFTTGVYLDALGGTRARILVNWLLPLNADGSTILDGSHYEIRYGVSPASTWQTVFAPWGDLQAQVLDLSPGVTYDFQIRAVDLAGNQGAWSATETATANPDTIPPSTPAPPTVAGSRIAIQITHTLGKASGGTYNLELDLHHLEVHVGASSGFTPDSTTLKGLVSAHAGMIAAHIPAVGTVDVEETTARWVRVIAVDEAGNRSAASSAVTATALLIDSAHISDLTASKITAGTLSADIVLGARIKTADTGQRVEINASGLQMYNAAGTQLVSIAPGSTWYLRSGTTGARLDMSTVTGLQIYNASGVRTVQLNVDGNFELRSAASGARIQLDGTGLAAFNSGGQQTVSIASSTGAATFVGTISTGFSGQRIVFNGGGASPSIKFYPSVGSGACSINSFDSDPNNALLMMESATVSNARTRAWLDHFGFAINAAQNISVFPQLVAQFASTGLYFQWQNSVNLSFQMDDGGVKINGSPYKSFIIDHPVHHDRYLVHACTESPAAGVEYWGETTLDEHGQAVVELPAYFEALTRQDGRYVSVNTCSDEIRNASATYPIDGRFTIHGGPRLRVTWLVKAIRADAGDMVVEPRRDEIDVQGQGPYLYATPR
ncbi:hypothetical protein [Nonomuraea sp. NPDC049646]|uniref:hypothetical protein n=1 Tax=unclassified Nonomuraea TaxID=2593643 RepID=UPI0037A6E344